MPEDTTSPSNTSTRSRVTYRFPGTGSGYGSTATEWTTVGNYVAQSTTSIAALDYAEVEARIIASMGIPGWTLTPREPVKLVRAPEGHEDMVYEFEEV